MLLWLKDKHKFIDFIFAQTHFWIQFILTDNSFVGFYLAQEAIDFLSSPELAEQKIGIIAVAGKYRTGKSFLLNRILLNKNG